ncbi:ABC transporter ATP-binding protein [Lysinibacillus xylanilyticus]|uniref:ATP-binding cassette domain-containing protein n=1 Tax=Lysinibacillus xylanilyticus TaxID=582475 RepID=A0ABT4ERN8_9BACI|nr:ATP-binding cassette domain-containing protein [Lysinibacillus xylanilyticus]MCY9548338.1 ATP-binding cassette domain-containing protein [Lysinibacillus xylanilyticus]
MISIIDLNLQTKKQIILEDINLNFKDGKIYGLLGPNGSGKTTLFKSILGLTNYDGEILYNNRPIKYAHVGKLIEYPMFYNNLTVLENLKLHGAYTNLENIDYKEILSNFDIYEAKDKKYSEISLGMKQRLGIARAIMGDPSVILLDEPTNGLDPLGIKSVRNLIKNSLRKPTNCILISSHNLTEIESISDELIFIKKGRIITKIKNNNNKLFYVVTLKNKESLAGDFLENPYVSKLHLESNFNKYIYSGDDEKLIKDGNYTFEKYTLEDLYEEIMCS